MIIQNVRALDPGVGVVGRWVRVEGGRIAAIGAGAVTPMEGEEVVQGGGRLLTPGLVDVHINGHFDCNFDNGPEDLLAAAQKIGRFGATTFIATVQPYLTDKLMDHLASLAGAIPKVEGACVPGLHLEGPFITVAGAASDPVDGDLGLAKELIAACGSRMKVMSLAPDAGDIIPVIELLVQSGISVFVTHTRATYEQTIRAIDAGARHATHFTDVFPRPECTEPGAQSAGAIEGYLAHPRGTVDFICDGVHVHPGIVRATYAAKGWEGIALATDANTGAGLPPGVYPTPWGYPIRLAEGDAPRIEDPTNPMHGALAGSALTMDRGINNLRAWLDIPEEHLWAMGTSTPAGIADLPTKGRLRRGLDADLVLWDDLEGTYTAVRTWVAGKTVYEG